jgi:predicted transglutaminase-like cysteine proteinase
MGRLYKRAWARMPYESWDTPRADFFRRHPDQRPQPLVEADVDISTLVTINTWVDNAIRFQRDGADTARPESWEIGAPTGDCDDRALTKRYLLNKCHGVPLGALNPVLGTQRIQINGVLLLHMMLCVTTTKGDVIMNDQPVSEVVPWYQVKKNLVLLVG